MIDNVFYRKTDTQVEVEALLWTIKIILDCTKFVIIFLTIDSHPCVTAEPSLRLQHDPLKRISTFSHDG